MENTNTAMKNCVFLFIFIVFLDSCHDKISPSQNVNLDFRPRKVTNVFISPGAQRFSYYQGFKGIDFLNMEGTQVTENNFFIAILSFNCDPRIDYAKVDSTYDTKSYMIFCPTSMENLDEPIPEVEQQIRLDFDKYLNQNKSSSSGGYRDALEAEEYRTTQIKSLIISALNTPLFGKPAGESLNDCFNIVKFDPPVIVSAPTQRLVYGYTSKEYPASIDEWLSIFPFGQASMYLVPNKKIEGLPLDVQLVVEMETAEGLILSDTTRMFTITE